jgi:hypothetical protein
MNTKFCHHEVALYLSIEPSGTYNVALLTVFFENVSDVILVLNGFSIKETTNGMSHASNALESILIRPLPIVNDAKPLQPLSLPCS